MAVTYYPGYEIEKFEDEGGNQFICMRYIGPKSSVDIVEATDAREKEIQEHQKREAIRKAEESGI